MITCPFCGTHYLTFQPNCNNCGGPLPPPAAAPTPAFQEALAPPPLPPRPITDRYAGRLMMGDGWAITAGIFALLGSIFSLVGLFLTLGIVTAFVGLPFLGLGLLFLAISIPVLYARYQAARKIVNVLRHGQAARGEIVQLEENVAVRVNGRHPWTIRYRFQVSGRDYTGVVRTLTYPGPSLQPGRPVYALYLPESPDQNAIYPHP